MSQDTDSFDVFVSYARRDDANGWITRTVEQLCAEHRRFFGGRELRCFFDRVEIRTADDWRLRIYSQLAQSRVFLAFLSPNYLASEWCRREWQAWLEQEIAKHILSNGAIPVYIVNVPGWNQSLDDAGVAREVATLCSVPGPHDEFASVVGPIVRQLRRRQHLAIQPFYDQGLRALRQKQMRQELKRLAQTLEERATAVRQAGQSLSNVPPYNRHFSGRFDELFHLRETMVNRREGVIAAINGMGGMGKTELALTYAHAFAQAYPGGRFFVRCENKPNLREALLCLGEIFREQLTDVERTSPDLMCQAILACLRDRLQRLGPALIVLDNVTSSELLAGVEIDWLAALGPQIHILATTRLASHPHGNFPWLTIDQLTENDALTILEKKRTLPTDDEHHAAQELVQRLGCYPLAVEIISSWLASRPTVSCRALLARLRADHVGTVGEIEKHGVEKRRRQAGDGLEAVLEQSLQELAPFSRRVLEWATGFHADSVPTDWLRELAEAEAGLPETPPGYERPWDAACRELRGFGLWSATQTSNQRVMRVHRLVQAFVAREFTPKRRQQIATEIAKATRRLLQAREDSGDWHARRWELSPLEALAEHWHELGHADTGWLFGTVGREWMTLGEWSRAEPLLRRAVDWHASQLQPDGDVLNRDLLNLAENARIGQRLDEAESLIDRACQHDSRLAGDNHPLAALVLINRASVRCAQQQYDEAEGLARRALAIDEALLGTDHPTVATDLNALAAILRQTHQLDDAANLLRRAITIAERNYGAESPRLTPYWSNLAALELERSRPELAEPWLQRALQLDERILGPKHPHVAATLNNLAAVQRVLHGSASAIEPLRRALEINEDSLGPAHPQSLRAMNNLADALHDANSTAEAEALFRRALATGKTTWGDHHPEQATTANNLARLLVVCGKVDEAQQLAEQALEVRRQHLGEVHPHVARSWYVLALIHQAAESRDTARDCGQRAVAILRQVCGENHRWTIDAVTALSRLEADSPAE